MANAIGNLGVLAYDIIAQDKTKEGTDSAKERMEKLAKTGLVVGGAMMAVGVAGNAFISKAKDVDAQLGQTALTMGVTDDELRNLMLSMTDASTPMETVIATFDQLSRAGVKNTDELKRSSKAFFTLADAIGVDADTLVYELSPAFNAFDIRMQDAPDHIDTVNWMLRNTNYTFGSFSNLMEKVGPQTAEMGLTFEDTAALIKILSDNGYDAESMISEIRKAITNSKGDRDEFYKTLGITAGKADDVAKGLKDAKGGAEEMAEVVNSKYTIIDDFRAELDKIGLELGEMLKPMEPAITGIEGIGTAVTGVSTAVLALNAVGGFAGIASGIASIGVAAGPAAAALAAFAFAYKSAQEFENMPQEVQDALGGNPFMPGPMYDETNCGAYGQPKVSKDEAKRMYREANGVLPTRISDQELRQHVLGRGMVPGFALGGIVTEPTLAMLGEAGPEVVLPLGKGGGLPATIIFEVSGREIAKATVRDIMALAGMTKRIAAGVR